MYKKDLTFNVFYPIDTSDGTPRISDWKMRILEQASQGFMAGLIYVVDTNQPPAVNDIASDVVDITTWDSYTRRQIRIPSHVCVIVGSGWLKDHLTAEEFADYIAERMVAC